MGNWKTAVFGDNRTNFYSWIIAGTLVFGVSLTLVILSARAGYDSQSYLLLAIYLVLAAQLAIQLQNYFSRVVTRIEADDKTKNGPVGGNC